MDRKEEGINRSTVADLKPEPMVQVGAACDISGFPVRGMHNNVTISPQGDVIRLKLHQSEFV